MSATTTTLSGTSYASAALRGATHERRLKAEKAEEAECIAYHKAIHEEKKDFAYCIAGLLQERLIPAILDQMEVNVYIGTERFSAASQDYEIEWCLRIYPVSASHFNLWIGLVMNGRPCLRHIESCEGYKDSLAWGHCYSDVDDAIRVYKQIKQWFELPIKMQLKRVSGNDYYYKFGDPYREHHEPGSGRDSYYERNPHYWTERYHQRNRR